MPHSCLLLPHGVYSLLAAVLTTMGWLSALFLQGCNYAKVSGAITGSVTALDVPYIFVGLQSYGVPEYSTSASKWEYSPTSECSVYPSAVHMDAAWNASKGFSFLALVLGGGATFYLWISTCCRFSRGSWRWAGYEVAAACFFQALSFVWFLTQVCRSNRCDLFNGSKADILATTFWFVAAVLIFSYYPAPKELSDGDGIMNTSNGSSNGSTSSRQQRRRSPRPVVCGDDLTLSETHQPISQVGRDEEMAAGQDSQQDGHITVVQLGGVELQK